MKIAISAEGNTQNSTVDPRFGRARWFVLYDSDSGQYEAVDNGASAEAMQGAGPKAAELLAGRKVEAVITGHCGPKAFQALKAAGIEVFVDAEGTVAEVVAKYKAGDFKSADGPDVRGHWQ